MKQHDFCPLFLIRNICNSKNVCVNKTPFSVASAFSSEQDTQQST